MAKRKIIEIKNLKAHIESKEIHKKQVHVIILIHSQNTRASITRLNRQPRTRKKNEKEEKEALQKNYGK